MVRLKINLIENKLANTLGLKDTEKDFFTKNLVYQAVRVIIAKWDLMNL